MASRQEEVMIEQNPCKLCGACCLGYQASFYWAEADDATRGGVPVRMTIRVGLFRRAMRRGPDGRCIALHGAPGHRVSCTIYNRRPSVCRNFEPAWQEGSGDSRCNESRARLGLPPFHRSAKKLPADLTVRNDFKYGLHDQNPERPKSIVSQPVRNRRG